MVKKTDEFNFDDDSFWKELDENGNATGGFNDSTKKSGARKAITDFTGSFLSGVKKTLLDPANQRKFLADNMPDGYAATFDAVSMGTRGIKEVYRETKDEFVKNLGDVSKDVNTLNKHYGKVLPKSLQQKINQKLENSGTGTYRGPTEEESFNNDINGIFAELTDVSKAAALAHQQTAESTTNRVVASQNTNTTAVSVGNKILSNISGNSDKLVGINFTQGKLARKHIELTFKSFVVQRQMLDTLQQTKAMQEKAFKLLIQNTGLPEAVKITNWELASRSLKQKMVGMATERITASFAPTASLIFNRIKENFGAKAAAAGGGLGMMMSMLAMQADMGEFDERSKASKVGGVAGMAGGNLMQLFLRKKLGDKFKNDPRFKVYGDSAMNFMDSFPGTFNKMQKNYGAFSQLMNLLGVGDVLTPDSALKTRVRASAHQHFDEVTSFNKKSEIALTEVIPGWLGKVHHQLKIMATGDPNAAEERYDFDKAVFTTRDDIASGVKSQMFNKNAIKDSKEKAKHIVDSLDKKGELSKKDRAILTRYVLQQANSDTGFIDPAALMNAADSPINKLDPKAAGRIAKVIRNENNFNYNHDEYSGADDASILFGNVNKNANYQASMRESNDLLKSLRLSMPKSKNIAVKHAGVGNIDILRDMGVITWDAHTREWRFNNDAMYDSIIGGKGASGPSGGPTPKPPSGGSPYRPGGGTGPNPMPQGGGGDSTGGGNPFGNTDPSAGGYTDFQRELLETIERTSSRTSVDVGNQVLEAIRQRLEMGIPQGGEAASAQQQDRKSSWFRKMLAGSMQATGKGIKSYFKFAKAVPTAIFRNFIQAPLKIARGVIDLPSRLMGFGKGKLSVIDSSSKRFSELVGDIYVRGKENAVIKVADLKAGNYFDATTKKVIKTFKDIKGAILDKDGNVIITADEVKNGLYTIIEGKTYSILGGALRLGMRVLSGAVRVNFASAKMVFNIAKGVVKGGSTAFNVIFGTGDVYVKGETTPRLLSRIMRAGGYFNKDGSPIKSLSDIRGDVVDGTGDVILSVADISKGLVDKYGKPLKTLREKVLGIALAPLKLAKNIVKAGMVLPFKILNSGRKSIAGFFKGKKNSTQEQILQAGSLDTLNKIYGLLDDRMPKRKGSWMDVDGSGYRDGSREDVLAHRTKDKTSTPEGGKTDDDQKDRKGIIGLLMGIAGGIGGLIGTVRGWAKNIFGLMRLASQTKLATSAFDAVGSIFGGRGGRGRGGKLSAIFRGAKNFITKSKVGKFITAGAIVAGAVGLSRSSWGSDAVRGAASAINGSGEAAEKDALSNGDFGSAPGSSDYGSGSGGRESSTGGSLTQRILTGAGGGVLGEVGAIAAFPALAALYQKAKGTKLGSKILPKYHAPSHVPTATTKTGKLIEFLTKSSKGRLIAAGLIGGGLVGGQHLLLDNDKDKSLGDSTTSSMGSTMMLDLAGATALPFAAAKGKQWWDKRKAMKAAAQPHFAPVNTPHATNGVFKPGVHPTYARAPFVGPTPAVSATPTVAPSAVVNAGAKAGIGSKIIGAGKGIFRRAGWIGTGMAAYDAMNTEGGVWDKTKAFGTSLLTNAAISKGLSVGGRLLSAGGRQALMQGARTAAGFVGRQVLMQGARTALMGAGGALIGAVGAPVVIGALALAAAGYAAWKGYKYFFATDKNAIARFRLAQYGFDLDDKEKATVIGQFEQLCQKNAVVDKSGKAYFGKNVTVEEIYKLFSISPNDKERIANFITWFNGRFKPIFLTAFAFYKGKTGKITLEKADEMPKAEKLAMLNAMGSPSGNPYGIMVTPFPDGKKLKYDAGDVKSELEKAIRNVSHEKEPGEKSFTDKVKDHFSKKWENAKRYGSKALSLASTGLGVMAAVSKNVGKYMVDQAKNTYDLGKNVLTGNWSGAWDNVKQYGRNMSNAVSNTVYDASTVIKMSGTQKEWQLRVYKAFKSAGFSEQQARIFTAEVGRENSYNPKFLFGGHADPKSGQNLGMISWQGSRRSQLVSMLQAKGAITDRGTITPDQKGLDAQCAFIMWELKNTEKKVGSKFLANPNISYKDGAYLIGKYYIRWAIDNPTFRAKGIQNRDGFYNMLLKQLGAKDGDGKTSSVTSSAANATPLANNAIPSKGAAGPAAKPASMGGGGGGGFGDGGWFGYLTGGGGGRTVNAADTAGGGMGGGTSLVAAAKSGTIVTSGKAADFLKSLDPKLIALGQKSTKLADKSVDVAGMVKGFMVIFYAMIGEAVNRGVLPTGVLVNSANRSIEKQKQLYDAYIRDPKHNPMAAKPGSSRHNFGIAIDINSGHANALAAAGLLGKYGFTRPLLNHPTKPEAWHLESEYFKRGSGNTVTEVAKATKDSGDKAKVDKATTEQAKKNPIVKAENQTKVLPPTIARPKSAEAQLRSLSSGFLGGGDNSTPTPITTPTTPTTSFMAKSTTSKASTTSAIATQQQRRVDLETATQEMLNVQTQQLQVQQEMVGVLHEIRDTLKTSNGNSSGAVQQDAPQTSSSSSSQRAAEMIRAKSSDIPVSMSVNR